MKKYIREMLEDLKSKDKDFIPQVPKGATKESVENLMPPTTPTTPGDLSNQILSTNAEEKVKQLDYQAFQSERRQTNQ